PEASELAHRPEPAAVHGRIDPARVGRLAGASEVGLRSPALQIIKGIDPRDRQAGQRGESWLTLFHQSPSACHCEEHSRRSNLTASKVAEARLLRLARNDRRVTHTDRIRDRSCGPTGPPPRTFEGALRAGTGDSPRRGRGLRRAIGLFAGPPWR